MAHIDAVTITRDGDRINFLAQSGACVAYLLDGDRSIVFDPLADTREMLGQVNYRDAFAAAGLTVATARMIDAMPRTNLMGGTEIGR